MSRKRSAIWNHFNPVDAKKAKCMHCYELISFVGGTTSNLSRHLKNKHPLVTLIRVNKPKIEKELSRKDSAGSASDHEVAAQPGHIISINVPSRPLNTNIESVSASASLLKQDATETPASESVDNIKPITLAKRQFIDEKLFKLVVKGYHPLSIVEEQHFKDFIYSLNRSYTLPTKRYMTDMLTMTYDRERLILEEKLREATALCLTTERWTTARNKTFIALTVHYIDEETAVKSYSLGCISYDRGYASANIAQLLRSSTEEWGISEKVVAVVTDNEPVLVAAVKECEWRHIPSFAHALNQIVAAGMAEIREIVDKVEGIVEFFNNPQCLAELQNIQSEMDLSPVELKQGVPSSWTSTLDMITRVLKNKSPILATLAILDQIQENDLTSEKWDVLDAASQLLQIFQEIVQEISSERHVSVSKSILLTKFMTGHVTNYTGPNNLPKIRSMAQVIKDQIANRLGDVECKDVTAHSTILDPRFKSKGFSDQAKYRNMQKTLTQLVSSLPAAKQRAPAHSNETTCGENSSSLWASFDEEVWESTSKQTPLSESMIELNDYLSEPLLHRLNDPLNWWRERQKMYPRLFQVMLKRLCIPLSVPCEGNLSKAERHLIENRNRLKSENLSKILFLHYNLT